MGCRSTRVKLDPAKTEALVAKAGCNPSSGTVIDAYGLLTAGRKFRRIVVRFSDGWRITFNMRANGEVSSTHFDIKLMAKGPAK